MSDKMKIMPFGNLIEWIVKENEKENSCFGVRKYYKADPSKGFNIYNEHVEVPLGPAAGPNSQLAQNIVASYVAGSRFFELKTVQELNGEALAKCVNKPCIKADDECYNCEWSTELYMKEAIEEYIKGWVALHFIAKEFNLGASDGFVFNMSVGYNLDDIKKKDTDTFINVMKDANLDPVFAECKKYLKDHISEYKNFTAEDVDKIPSRICDSVTESTLHGCPPEEIEKIATYLMLEKRLNTFIKCNPTLLGYETARAILDEMGYDYIAFTDSHFLTDLQYSDAIAMLKRLNELADKEGLTFGVKLTNTFPVDVTRNELPSNEMYMSGKSLFGLSIKVAQMLSTDFNGKLKIAYSGGADFFNIDKLVNIGIWPVTVATTILKPGGYERLVQMSEKILKNVSGRVDFKGIDVAALDKLAEDCKKDNHLVKKSQKVKVNKLPKKVPLISCFTAPCSETCPINQDISLYNYYVKKEEYEKALDVIYKTNPLPFMTGNICAHPCMVNCMRNHYEDSVNIRGNKLIAAKNAYDNIISKISKQTSNGKKVAVVGAGPGGIAVSSFLARSGFDVTVYDKDKKAGGTVANIIPKFRIPFADIEKDVNYAKAFGVKFELGKEITDIKKLKSEFDFVVLAIGAHKGLKAGITGEENCISSHKFLREFNDTDGKVSLGKSVAVIGGGNTAMDCVRAAKRCAGVENVYLVYRRNLLNAPCDEEESDLAIKEGVIIKELLAPKSFDKKVLVATKCKLGALDEKGRNTIETTSEVENLNVDCVITAIGEGVDGEFYKNNGMNVDEKQRPVLDKNMMTSMEGVYSIGDGALGASIIVNAIRDAKKVASAIAGITFDKNVLPDTNYETLYKERGILKDKSKGNDGDRCLHCNYVCETCNEVCPNRANVHVILSDGSHQVVHVDNMCNECGNCASFCPYDSRPYKDKWTLFSDDKAMKESTNDGFYYKDDKTAHVRLAGNEFDYQLNSGASNIGALSEVIDKIKSDRSYMIY